MMLYTKYESSGPCSIGQKDFFKLHFFLPCYLLMQPTETI